MRMPITRSSFGFTLVELMVTLAVATILLVLATPSFVDMPTMWVHNIRNVGDRELLTMFWADQLLDAGRPDQYPEKVTP